MLGKLKTLYDFAALPFHENVEFDRDGNCYLDGELIDSSDLNLGIEHNTLWIVAFHAINLAPVYWKYLKVKCDISPMKPEACVLGFDEPVETLDYPGFYVIPYYSDYVISRDGKLLKKSNSMYIEASRTTLGYYTFRMADDSRKTSNVLRHRILSIAFLEYPADVNSLDVNHLNGVKGDDFLDNLEWCTRSRNMDHAYDMGLRTDNIPVQIKDTNTNMVYIFRSCSDAGEFCDVTGTTITNRIKSGAENIYNGYQFRYHPCDDVWPSPSGIRVGRYIVKTIDGGLLRCNGEEAARLLGLTRTSFLRMVREGRRVGKTQNILHEILGPTGE